MNRRRFIRTVGAVGLSMMAQTALTVQPIYAQSSPDLSQYPLLFARKDPSGVSVQSVQNPEGIAQLLMVGDVSMARGVADLAAANGMDYPLSQVSPWLRAAHLATGNYEGVIADLGVGAERRGNYRLHTLPVAAPTLARAGFGLLNLANNHSMDLGPDGLAATFQNLRSAGMLTIGAGADGPASRTSIMTTVNGVKIAWLSFTSVPDPPDNDRDREDGWSRSWYDPVWGFANLEQYIREARGAGEVLIVQFHWGNEYVLRPKDWQFNMARTAVDAGASLVVGHHPHVMQPYEVYKGAFIAYSLGNFLFDQLRQPGLALWVRLDQSGLIDVRGLTLIPSAYPTWNPPSQSVADLSGFRVGSV